jgi:hypothetical protein
MDINELKIRFKEKLKSRYPEAEITDLNTEKLELKFKKEQITERINLANLLDSINKISPTLWENEINKFVENANPKMMEAAKKEGKLTFRFKSFDWLNIVKEQTKLLPYEKREQNELIIVETVPLPIRHIFGDIIIPALETETGFIFLTKGLAESIKETPESLKKKWEKMKREASEKKFREIE